MKNKRKGISLIVLVITIIVMLILASAIVITLSNTNIITKAREATLKTDVKNFEQELSLTLADKKLEDNAFNMDNVNATDIDNIQEYIPSLDSKYDGKIAIKNGEVVYVNYNVTDEEKTALEEIGVTSGEYITSEQATDILQKVTAANLTDTDSTTNVTKLISDVDTTQADKFVIYKGHLYYRYERTTLEERKILQQAGISCLMGDCNANGTIDEEDVAYIEGITAWVDGEYPMQAYYVGDINSDGWIDAADYSFIVDTSANLYDFVVVADQIPEKMYILGLSRIITYLDSTVSTTDYVEIMEMIPNITAKDAKKLVIQEGVVYINSAKITEQEKTWLEEVSALII